MDIVKLSKTMAHALRHAPEEYGLILSEGEGWVNYRELLLGIAKKTSMKPTLDDLKAVLAIPGKRRYELSGGYIRAFNGHSVEQRIEQEHAEPPRHLYHGTVLDALEAIKVDGLKPMSRQYVHLSEDRETAIKVGNRRRSQTIVLQVDALLAHTDGVKFYRGVDGIWMADEVPVMYIKVLP